MKILVTGGTGFAGRHLVEQLRGEGHEVSTLSLDAGEGEASHVVADVCDRDAVLDVVQRFDLVYHLAGLLGTHELLGRSHEAVRVNILGTINILDGARLSGAKVVYVGKPNLSLNTYSITKGCAEAFTTLYNHELELASVSVRWFSVYGPEQSFHTRKAAPYFIRWALRNEPIEIWGAGNQTLDLIYVTDAIAATVRIAKEKSLEGQSIEVGSGVEISVNDLARLIIRLAGSRSEIRYLPMRPGEPLDLRVKADTRALANLGFAPQVGLEEGLAATIDWYRQQANTRREVVHQN
jgi:UDP-glucose 4-epimerase